MAEFRRNMYARCAYVGFINDKFSYNAGNE